MEEICIIEKLNSMNCISVPKLKSYGTYKGKSYYITERVRESGAMNDVDALFAFLELKGCGVIHGDMGKYEKKYFVKSIMFCLTEIFAYLSIMTKQSRTWLSSVYPSINYPLILVKNIKHGRNIVVR